MKQLVIPAAKLIDIIIISLQRFYKTYGADTNETHERADTNIWTDERDLPKL